MKQTLWTITIFVAILLPALCFAEIPYEIAGFKLGAPLEEFQDRCNLDSSMPLRYTKFIEELETQYIPGFKNGLLWVGKCVSNGRIVRIRMKYADSSKKFYNELLKRCKKRFGKPAEWRGDPFHIVISWKWSFVDDNNNRISMILEHNIRNQEETSGNTIKLTMWNLIDQERECAAEKKTASSRPKKKTKQKQVDWELLLPR
jgi:hypothetical protein